jgi:hypothetical protein
MKKIDKRRYLYFALLLVIILSAVIYARRGHFYEVDIYKSGNGWGYDIMKNNKSCIHQPYMPVLEGQVPFSNKQSARKTGQLVIKKIRHHKSPAVTREELKSIIGN